MLPTEPVLTVDILLDLPLFRGESPDALEWLLHTATLRTLTAGEILLETGQINNTLFLILHGQLRIQLDTAGMQNLALLMPATVSVSCPYSMARRSPPTLWPRAIVACY